MSLQLRIALRYLFARKSHSAVNLISAVSVAGIAVATMAIVCVLSVFNGFTDLALSRLSVFDPAVKITPASGSSIADADSLAASIADALAGGATAEPVVESRALAISGDRQLTIDLKGVGESYGRAEALDSVIIDGVFIPDGAADSRPYATIGVGAAIRLGLRPDPETLVSIFVPRRRGRINPANPLGAFRADSAIVSAVFQLDQTEYDNTLVILPIASARRLLDFSNEATAIEVNLPAGADSDAAIASLKRFLGPSFVVSGQMEQHIHSYRMIAVEKWISLLLLVFILVIASFNVLSSISMLVLEKKEDIGVLAALGAPRTMIRRIFMNQGMAITLAGGAIGILLGASLCAAQQHWGFIRLGGDPSQLSIEAYPVKLEAADLLICAAAVAAVAVAVGVISRMIAASVASGRPAEP